jgi:outer membrane protein assembly factor BamD
MKINRVFLYYIIVLLIAGCSQYEKILKGSDYELKYRTAFAYYNKKDYTRASGLFEQINNVYRGSLKGDSVNFFLADSYYKMNDFMMAGEYFKTFEETYSRSPFVEKASYLKNFCFYKLSPRPELDQQNTKMAIAGFELFIVKYPQSEFIPDCKRLMSEMRDKLMEKSYLNAKLYYNIGHYKAAILALRNSLSEYPDTKHREEMKYILLKSCYELADKSVPEKRKERFQDTLDEYFSFIDEFPSSKYKKDAEKIYQSTLKVLGNNTNDNN